MKKTEDLIHLGYPGGALCNEYYTARVTPEEGVTVAYMLGDVVMIQFFPWTDEALSGHETYAKFITDRASQVMASKGELFVKYPFVTAPTTDLLMIKCLIEDATQEMIREKHSNRTA
jgi:hypothetical protein